MSRSRVQAKIEVETASNLFGRLSSAIALGAMLAVFLILAMSLETSQADMIHVPDEMLEAHLAYDKATGPKLSHVELVCLSGVVMMAAAFFQKVGAPPVENDKATPAEFLVHEGMQDVLAEAEVRQSVFLSRPLQELVKHSREDRNSFIQELVCDGFTEFDAGRLWKSLVYYSIIAERIEDAKERSTKSSAQHIQKKMKTGRAFAEHILLKVKDRQGSELHFEIKKNEPLQKLVDAYRNCLGLQTYQVRLMFHGELVASDDTAEKLGLNDADFLDVEAKM